LETETGETKTVFHMKSIGTIRTPFTAEAPNQPSETEKGEFRIVLSPQYAAGLYGLLSFRYLYVIYYMDRVHGGGSMKVRPPGAGGREVGLFASRSPVRPNPIGLSIVRLLKIVGNEIFTSGLDVFDGTPLLDIKPYIEGLDSKEDANNGWLSKKLGAK
jgi:tRNA-Thr(GGU) m(6)t(6)A37 methyltransferase TsaA